MAPHNSKRRSRRAVSDEEEDIEEPAASSQRSRIVDADQDAEEEEQREQHIDRGNGEDEDGPLFDPDTFMDVALDPVFASKKIKSFGDDYATLAKRIDDNIPVFTSVAVALEETHESGENDSSRLVEQAMRDLLDAQQELEIQRVVLRDMAEFVGRRDSKITDAEERFEKALKKSLNKYRTQTSRQKYAESDAYVQYRQDVWEVMHKEAMPPVKSMIEKEDEDSDSGSDIEVGGVSQNFTCQLTLQPFVKPMTSRVCKHSFSQEPLRNYFMQIGGKADCPAAGCNKKLGLADFELNLDLERRAKAAARRERQRVEEEDDDDDDEVV
ncbi:hypothetical protein FRB94_010911 [Tulasnella sp. JGI-2019a]|nr:hypothetical protein FRB93_009737 [Tulasnella sp. JGI-2019a]KAG9010212.1 hypothetical protein FRB94_010911 [Tulasnella sp. JGI-2019a]KAG9035600.1 hypothetical protein FRB95_011006 [Tulasnella sp. JGI-2019a]